MRISIITVSFNAERTIEDTILSVASQDYEDIEYIVVDGESKDRTCHIIRQHQKVISKWISEPDGGIYDAMNKGIKLATGDVIGILNADDFYANVEVIANVVEAFKRSAADIIFGDLVYVARNDINCVTRHYSSKKFQAWKLRFGWMPPHPATFIRRSVYDKAGLYSTDYTIASDYEMFVRLFLVCKCSFFRIPQVLVRMRLGGISTNGIKSSWLLNREIVKACRNNNVYTNMFLVLSKIPFKLFELWKRPSWISKK